MCGSITVVWPLRFGAAALPSVFLNAHLGAGVEGGWGETGVRVTGGLLFQLPCPERLLDGCITLMHFIFIGWVMLHLFCKTFCYFASSVSLEPTLGLHHAIAVKILILLIWTAGQPCPCPLPHPTHVPGVPCSTALLIRGWSQTSVAWAPPGACQKCRI